MAKNIIYRCLVCGGELKWKPELSKWKCDYCDSEFTLGELEAAGKGTVEEETVQKGEKAEEDAKTTDGTKQSATSHLVEYTCSYCGASLITDETTAATFCAYCQSPIVISESLSGEFAPNFVIPFKKTREQVISTYQKTVKKILTPKVFYTKDHIEKITGIYVPFFLYDAQNEGQVKVEGRRISTWQTGKQRYTKTDIFHYEVDGELTFAGVPVDASSKMDNAAMDSVEPFDYQELVAFSPAYLAGFMAERYDEDANVSKERAVNRMKTTFRSELEATAPPYNTKTVLGDDMHCNINANHYVLMPTWILNTKYKGKDYLFAMNGQTGKFIGNTPIDWPKALLITLLVFAGSTAVIYIFAIILGMLGIL